MTLVEKLTGPANLRDTMAMADLQRRRVLRVTMDRFGMLAAVFSLAFSAGNLAGAQLSITGPSSPLPSATVQIAYAPQTFTASGGAGNYTWSQTGLPAATALGLSTGGVLSGTP